MSKWQTGWGGGQVIGNRLYGHWWREINTGSGIGVKILYAKNSKINNFVNYSS